MGELHHRQVARHLERELEAFLAFGLGGGPRRLDHVGRYPVQFIRAGVVREGVGGVKRVLAEFLAQLRLPLLDRREALLGSAGELRAAQHEIADCVLVRLALLRRECGRIDRLVFREQAFVRTQPGPEVGDLGQHRVVGGAQLGRVGHAVEVADDAPGAAEPLGGGFQHLRDVVPAAGEVGGGHGGQRLVGLRQQLVDGRGHVLGPDFVEAGEVGESEEWIAAGHPTDFASAPADSMARGIWNAHRGD